MNAALNAFVKSGVGRLPVPIFGTTATMASYVRYKSRSFGPGVTWGFPLVVGGLWFIWPAVDTEWKISMGFLKDPNPPPPVADSPVKLDAKAKQAVADVIAPASHTPSEKEIQVGKELRMGKTDTLEGEWDDFIVKAIKPGEDDDDDDEEEDEDDEEEEEEEDEDDDDE